MLQEQGNQLPRLPKFEPTGWVDVTPATNSSNKGYDVLTGWGQWRLYADGTVRLRGSIQRNSGNWGSSEHVGTLPGALLRPNNHTILATNGSNGFFIDPDGNIYAFNTLASPYVYFYDKTFTAD
jgi:hypothetical protein